jgi:hypothetical protein
MSLLSKWRKKIDAWWQKHFSPPQDPDDGIEHPPAEDPQEPPTNPPQEGELTDAEAKDIIAGMQFLSGKKDSPDALRVVKLYGGKRISHFGGGNDQPANESTLWKPVADSGGGLVVILPSHVGAFPAASVNGERVTGMSIGNGWRPHLRFSKPGASYGSNVRLVVEGVGSAVIPRGHERQSFKLSNAPTAPADPEVPANSPYYKPGEVELPIEFTRHGGIVSVQIGPCKLSNGLVKPTSSPTRFTLPPPADPAWGVFASGKTDTGTKVVCKDGKAWEGYLKDNRESVPMPLLTLSTMKGHAFWIPL